MKQLFCFFVLLTVAASTAVLTSAQAQTATLGRVSPTETKTFFCPHDRDVKITVKQNADETWYDGDGKIWGSRQQELKRKWRVVKPQTIEFVQRYWYTWFFPADGARKARLQCLYRTPTAYHRIDQDTFAATAVLDYGSCEMAGGQWDGPSDNGGYICRDGRRNCTVTCTRPWPRPVGTRAAQ